MIDFAPDTIVETHRLAALLRAAVTQHPGDLRSRRALVATLIELGLSKELVAAAEDCADVAIRAAAVKARIGLGDIDGALARARALHAEAPDDQGAGAALLDALRAAGLPDQHARIAASMPWLATRPDMQLGILIGAVAKGEARAEQLLACADAILANRPGDAYATYSRAIALVRLGRDADAVEALALDRHVAVSALTVDLDALATEIRANPTFTADPALNTTSGGRQTLQLRQPGDRALPALMAAIEAAITAYAAARAGIADPFAAAMPRRATLRSWAVICGPKGRQRPHLHPAGWVSGVFYVAAPIVGGTARGVLKIGPVGGLLPGVPPWGIREIEPVPGRLVLFSSWTPHATQPSGVAGDRIVVAFDAIPQADGGASIPS